MAKPKLALYWAASCGGCEIAVLDLHEKILDVANAFDIVFWPVAMDFKYADVRAMEDKSIDICLFNGAIRNSENEELAHLMRAKSKVLVAFGSCAYEGGIPGLANLTTKEEIFKWVYRDSPSTIVTNGGVYPQTHTKMPEGEIEIPEMYEVVKSLDQVVAVEYYIPGCPPQPKQIWSVIEYILSGQPLPPAGSILGAGDKTCCDECPLEKKEKKLKNFYRPYEIIPDPNLCLLDQGIVCMGPATRSGCEALCPKANMACRGCYGPPPNCLDQGAKMVSALGSVIDAHEPEELDKIFDQIVDPIGTFYTFSLPHSILRRKQQ
ncbi:MAG: oxidoreductase [Bacteroidetes bacterium]|nr:oxidoreductase [Bacteroidota bacterium]MBU1422693.1 oxidoreductase [Bacteroidota bacterium]MBU2636546.1 oxidoreductase [Bacteroidota bacterium]